MPDEKKPGTTAPENSPKPTEPAPANSGDADSVKLTAEIEKWKAAAQANADKAKAYDAAEENAKTDMQKLTSRAEKAETELAALRASALRNEVAAAKGLTADQAKRLIGATRQDLEADADALLAAFPAPKPERDFGAGKQGSDIVPTSKIVQLGADALKTMKPADIVAAKKAGQFNDLLGIKPQ